MDTEAKKILLELLTNSKIASLGTCNNNQPYVSMVSFSVSDDFSRFYILVSGLAKHTKNIEENNKVSLMITQPETISDNPQKIARVTNVGQANIIFENNKDYTSVKNNYLKKNPSAEMYFNLGDFNLYEISVDKIRYVAGFGNTFNLSYQSLQSIKTNN